MTGWWWLRTNRMTVGVRIEDGIVVEAAPIVRRFIGQPSKNLGGWLRKQGGFAAVPLEPLAATPSAPDSSSARRLVQDRTTE